MIGARKHLELHDVSLEGEDFSERRLSSISVSGAYLRDCRWENVRIESASLGGGRRASHYVGCKFDGARIDYADGGFARFVDCSFRDVKLRHLFCLAVEFINCTFSGVMEGAVIHGSVPAHWRSWVGRDKNEIRGNDFSGMSLIDVGFRGGVDLSLQKLPTGDDYLYVRDAAEAVSHVRRVISAWTDLEARRRAFVLTGILEDKVRDGQRQLFTRPSDYDLKDREFGPAYLEVFRLLSEHSRTVQE
jgi:hypothetical protein